MYNKKIRGIISVILVLLLSQIINPLGLVSQAKLRTLEGGNIELKGVFYGGKKNLGIESYVYSNGELLDIQPETKEINNRDFKVIYKNCYDYGASSEVTIVLKLPDSTLGKFRTSKSDTLSMTKTFDSYGWMSEYNIAIDWNYEVNIVPGEYGTLEETKVLVGAKDPLPTPTAIEGYRFTGWSNKDTSKYPTINITEKPGYTDDAIYYAIYEKHLPFDVEVVDDEIEYTGRSIKPEVIVKSEGKVVSSDFYYLEEVDEKVPGDHAVRVIGIKDYDYYEGVANFKIIKETPQIFFNKGDKVEANLADKEFVNLGYTNFKNKVTYEIASGGTNAVVDSKTGVVTMLKAGDVTVRATAKENAGTNSNTKDYKLTINPIEKNAVFKYKSISVKKGATTVSNELLNIEQANVVFSGSSKAGSVNEKTGVVSLNGTLGHLKITATITNKNSDYTYTSNNKLILSYYIYVVNSDSSIGSVPNTITGGNKTDVSSLSFNDIPDQTYKSGFITPEITLSSGETLSDDIIISYQNNYHAGSAVAEVRGTNDFCGVKIIPFNINSIDISKINIHPQIEVPARKFTNRPIYIQDFNLANYNSYGNVSSEFVNKELFKDGIDFTKEYVNNVLPPNDSSGNKISGTATINITGTGDITGTTAFDFKITSGFDKPTYSLDRQTMPYMYKTITLPMGMIYDSVDTNYYRYPYGGDGNGYYLRLYNLESPNNSKRVVCSVYEINVFRAYDISSPNGSAEHKIFVHVYAIDRKSKFENESVTKTYGDDNFINTLTDSGDDVANKSFYSSDTDVAVVNNTTGEVTLKGAGKTTIYTAVSGTNNFNKEMIKYELTVNKKNLSSSMISYIDNNTSILKTGKAIEPIQVIDGDKVLTEGVDYTIEYSNNINSGEATAVITGIGNYSGSVSSSFTILPNQSIPDDDEPQEPVSKIYTVTFNPGQGSFSGTETGIRTAEEGTTFTIPNNPSMEGKIFRGWVESSGSTKVVSVSNIMGDSDKVYYAYYISNKLNVSLENNTFTYTGSEITPNFSVSSEEGTLSSNNYTYTYLNNINAGTATITVTGTGDYEGTSGSATFTIGRKTGSASFEKTVVNADSKDKEVVNKLTVDGDGTVTYTISNTQVGSINSSTGVVTLNGNKGTATIKAVVSNKTNGNYKYGSSGTLEVTYTLNVTKKSYTVTFNPGQGSFSGTETGIRTAEEGATFTIPNNPSMEGKIFRGWVESSGSTKVVSVSNIMGDSDKVYYAYYISNKLNVSLENNTFTYTGSEITPNFSVSSEEGTLSSNNYTYTYLNNINAGTATITVTGTGDYDGASGSATFTIGRKTGSAAFEKIVVNADSKDKEVVNKLTVDGDGTVTYTISNTQVGSINSSTGVVTLNGNKGTATIKAVVSNKTNGNYKYGSTGTLEVTYTLNVTKKSYTVTFNPGQGAFSGTETGIRTAEEGATFTIPNNPSMEGKIFRGWVESSGSTKVVSVSNIMGDSDKVYYAYYISNKLNVTVQEGSYIYSGNEIKPIFSVATEEGTLSSSNYTYTYSNNINAGTATITVTGTGEYEGTSGSATFTIGRKMGSAYFVNEKITVDNKDKQALNTLIFEGDGIVSYYMTGDNVGIIDSQSGIITLSGNTGSATVHAIVSNKSGGNYKYSDEDTIEISYTLEVTKEYVPTTFVVTFNAGDGSFVGNETGVRSGETGTKFTIPKNPSMEGKIFRGWVASPESTQIVSVSDTIGSANQTYYAYYISSKLNIIVEEGSYTYSGEEIKPSFSVSTEEGTLSSSNYTYTYSNNINAGTATITVTGTGEYEGTSGSATFTIGRKTGNAYFETKELEVDIEEETVTNSITIDGDGVVSYSISQTEIGDIDSETGEITLSGNTGNAVVTAVVEDLENGNYTYGTAGRIELTYTITAVTGEEDPAPYDKNISIYRLYNTNTGEHLFTSKINEYNKLMEIGWEGEGKTFDGYLGDDLPDNAIAIYRLFNPNGFGGLGDHHYTKSQGEINKLLSAGWKLDFSGEPAFYVKGEITVYKLYSKKTGAHHYTPKKGEADKMEANGWIKEGIAWYVNAYYNNDQTRITN